MADAKKTTRVQFELPEVSMERLVRLKEKTESASYAEVFKNSLRLYEEIINQFDAGHEFIVRDKKTGRESVYVVF